MGAGARLMVNRATTTTADYIQPTDVVLSGEQLYPVTTTGATDLLPAAAITSGLVRRTGPTANYADVWDSAANIIAALAGNGYAPEAILGNSFRLRVINGVAFTNTPTFGTGVLVGTGTTSQAASAWRDYVITILNTQPVSIIAASTTNGSKVVSFYFAPGTGRSGHIIGPSQTVFCTVGALVTGTGIAAGTTVTSVQQGPGGMTGCTLSANATATNSNIPLTFNPTVQVDSIGSGPL